MVNGESEESTKMLNVGVIGVGNMGRHHARIYSQMPGVRLAGVADSEETRALNVAALYGANAYGDYREMLRVEALDAVSVVVPTRGHLAAASDAIQAGVHLLVEKPLASTPAEATVLVQAARSSDLVLAVGHIERFNPAVLELKRLVESGKLGAISSIIAKRVGVMPPQVRDANVIVDLAVHDIDILNYFLGEIPTEISATAGRALLSDRYDHAEIFLKYNIGAGIDCRTVGGFIQVNWITPLKIRTLSVTGDLGHAELNYVTQKLEVYQSNIEREFRDFGEFVVRFGEADRVIAPVEIREPLRGELEDFIRAIKTGTSPSVTGEDGLNALRVAADILATLERSH